MTPSLSSSTGQLDLATITAVRQVVIRELRNQVCNWEQKAIDAEKFGDHRSARQYQDWAFAAELSVSSVFTACAALFQDAAESIVVKDTRTVELPNLSRSAEDCYLDALTVEVASYQTCPSD